MVWKVTGSLYEGLSSVLAVYISAKFTVAVVNVITNDKPIRSAVLWLVLLGLDGLIGSLYYKLDRLFSNRFRQKMEFSLNKVIFEKMYSLSQAQFDNEEFNTKLSRATDSLFSIQTMFYDFFGVISTAVRFVSSFVAVLIVSPVLALVTTVASIPAVFIGMKSNKLEEKMYREDNTDQRLASRTRWLLLDPHTMPEIRIINAFKSMASRWQKDIKKSQDREFRLMKKVFKMEFGTDLFPALIEFGGGVYLLMITVSKGFGLDKFLFVRSLLSSTGTASASLARYASDIHKLLIDFANFEDVFNTKPLIGPGSIKAATPLTIEFKNVTFRYPSAEQDALKNVSFLIFPGSKLAIVGENGAGKSTIIKLILRQYLPTAGEILVNGVNIENVDEESYYQALSCLSQNFLSVSHYTVRENMVLGSQGVTDEQVNLACELAGVDEFVPSLKHGLNTRLDSSFDDGGDVSGGQLQRIGVARALLRNGDVLLLDEPTSAIDAKAEYKIFNNIYKHHGDKTTIIISHRFSTVRRADKIMVVEKGVITEYGSHDELIKYGGTYKEMFELQAEGYR